MRKAKPVRTIFHVDLDAFFVAVERSRDPSLAGKPVVVGGAGPRGVVSAASYEVREFGVHSAMPMSTARHLAPHAIFISPNHGQYGVVSRKFMDILRDFSPLVEPVSVDEAYLDMTGMERIFGPPAESASSIKRRVNDELSIVASIGIGHNRLVAKVASGESKPDGLLLIQPQDAAGFFAPLLIRKLPGIGPKAADRLHSLGIESLGQLAETPIGVLRRAVGERQAAHLRRRATGEGGALLSDRQDAKSVSAETTFDYDVSDRSRLDSVILTLSEKVGRRLRRARRQARVVAIKLRYDDFETVNRQRTLASGIDGDTTIYESARTLLNTALRERNRPVRLVGVAVSGLNEREGQLALMEDVAEPDDSAVSGAIDRIRERYGDEAIARGRVAARSSPRSDEPKDVKADSGRRGQGPSATKRRASIK